MTAKEYLSQARWLDKRINSKLAMAETLYGIATKTTSHIVGDVVCHTHNVHSMQDTLAKRIDLEKEIDADIDRLYDLRAEIANIIAQVTDPACRVVLEYRYLSNQSWNVIAVKLALHIRSVFRLHERALQEVEQIIAHQQKSCHTMSSNTM